MRKVPLTGKHGQDKFAIVDDDIAEHWIASTYNWRVDTRGYVLVTNGVQLHRFVTSAPQGTVVDHANGNRLDNRRENLRVCTHAENARNKPKQPISSQPYKGIIQAYSRWRAQITLGGERFYLGSFDTPEDAALAYDVAAIQLHDEFAYLNFVGR